MNFDQYEDLSPEMRELAKAIDALIEVLFDKDGNPVDIAEKESRMALTKALSNIPKEIPANLREVDRKLLNTTIEECRETRKMIKNWFWYIIGTMFLASSVISLCAVMLIK